MKEGLEIKKFSFAISIVGLAMLLLFSPCKVRNFVEAELGLPQSEVLNKSQSVVSQFNCQTIEVAKAIQPQSKPTVQQPVFLVAEASDFEFRAQLHSQLFTPFISESQLVPDIPLYILYQNLQIYA